MFLYLCPYELAAEKVSKWTVNHAEFIFLPGGFAGANSITTIHEESNSKNLIVSADTYPGIHNFPLSIICSTCQPLLCNSLEIHFR